MLLILITSRNFENVFFSYQSFVASLTFAVSLQRLNSNHKKERNEKVYCIFEIPTVDFHRAVDFYETVFGVQLPVFECEEEKMACFTEEGETVGAIFHAPDYLPSEKGVIISFNCEDIDQTLEKVLRKGGKIMMPKTKIEVEGRGWFALFADSEGNRVGLYADK